VSWALPLSAKSFGPGASIFDPETMALTALCGGCASPYDLKTCSKSKRTKFCSWECLAAIYILTQTKQAAPHSWIW